MILPIILAIPFYKHAVPDVKMFVAGFNSIGTCCSCSFASQIVQFVQPRIQPSLALDKCQGDIIGTSWSWKTKGRLTNLDIQKSLLHMIFFIEICTRMKYIYSENCIVLQKKNSSWFSSPDLPKLLPWTKISEEAWRSQPRSCPLQSHT